MYLENDDWLARNEAIDWLAAAQEKLVRDITNGVIGLAGLPDAKRRFEEIVEAQRSLQVGASVEALARRYPGLFRIFDRGAAAGAERAERQAGNKATPVKFADSTPTGGEAVSCETTIQKTATRRKGGRKPGSGRINDDPILLDMLRLLAAEQATAVWNAAGKFANGNQNLQRRYQKHFKQKWGLEPPLSKTWKGVLEDVERKLNTN